ncbi:MFS transporter [Achromobacter sp. GG226]|uniref:MFS transporter n=1 Tax=Verticiella alkaliphila TaxID=2779529 RepID=UPI001C0B4FC1|nr:MFS transporter [Verticiella sp. GG226]MBU4610663.1 MFS transporter [Verticiella sp. GG226]
MKPLAAPETVPGALTERAYRAQVLRDLKRNYIANLAHGMLGMTGFRLVSAPTFVPAYIYLLSGSQLAVGIALSAQFLGMAMSSIWGATLIEHRHRVMPMVYLVGWLMRAQILGLAVSAWLLDGAAALVAACLFLGLFGFFGGMQGVSFHFLMSKVIPVNKRGRLTGMRNFLGGLAAAAVAWAGGRYLVEHQAFGNGYASTFFVAFILTSLGISALSFVREPPSPDVHGRRPFLGSLRELPDLLRADPAFTRFFIARALAALGMVGVPFYAIYTGRFLALTGTSLAVLSLSFLLAQTVSNLAWGRLADRRGNRAVFLASVSLWAAGTALLLANDTLAGFALAFAALGAGHGGFQLSAQNLVLEFGTRADLPMRIAVSDTACYAMMATGPILGGVIAESAGFIPLFAIAIAVKVLALAAILRVPEPRFRTQPARQP